MNNPIRVVSLVGPTASGKTKLSVALAKHFDGEIISADSMQIYQGMTVATAKPDKAEQGGIPHHLMDFLPPDKTYSVAMFVQDAKRCIEEISGRGKLPFIVGGTGLYVDSLLNNIRFSDEVRDEDYSRRLREQLQSEGVEPLLALLCQVDPVSAQRLSAEKNPKRIIRALEFYHTTGKTIRSTRCRRSGSRRKRIPSALSARWNFTIRRAKRSQSRSKSPDPSQAPISLSSSA